MYISTTLKHLITADYHTAVIYNECMWIFGGKNVHIASCFIGYNYKYGKEFNELYCFNFGL